MAKGIFARAFKAVATAAVGAAAMASSELGSNAKHFVDAERFMDRARNSSSALVRKRSKPSKRK